MARTPAGDQLTAAYRGVLATQRARTVRDLLILWPLLKIDDLDTTYDGWATAVKAVIARDRAIVTRDTDNYLRGFKAVEVGELPDLAAPDEIPVALLDTSLRVTSYVAWFRALRQTTPARAAKAAFVQSSGAATRHVLNAGRSASMNSAQKDPRALGWTRLEGSGACPFCRGLAGRVSRVEAGVDFQAHDHCLGSAELIYR